MKNIFMPISINRFFPYLLILSVIAAGIEVDLSLPSFPDIARAFSVPEELVERTISLNFLKTPLSKIKHQGVFIWRGEDVSGK